MPEDKLIDPAWLVKARRDRKRFAARVALVFAILSILAWWALPRLEARHKMLEGVRVAGRTIKADEAPTAVKLLAKSAGFFQVFWTAIAIACAVAVVLGFTGKIDTLMPVLNLVVLLVGAAAVGLTFYVFYAPTLLLING